MEKAAHEGPLSKIVRNVETRTGVPDAAVMGGCGESGQTERVGSCLQGPEVC